LVHFLIVCNHFLLIPLVQLQIVLHVRG
jgi:hypothetical protein